MFPFAAISVASAPMLVFAAEVATEDPTSRWLDYGVLGALAAILIAFARSAYKRESDRADAGWAEVARLNGVIQDKYITALETNHAAITANSNLMVELRAELNATRPKGTRR